MTTTEQPRAEDYRFDNNCQWVENSTGRHVVLTTNEPVDGRVEFEKLGDGPMGPFMWISTEDMEKRFTFEHRGKTKWCQATRQFNWW